jgi:hypothetical protein
MKNTADEAAGEEEDSRIYTAHVIALLKRSLSRLRNSSGMLTRYEDILGERDLGILDETVASVRAVLEEVEAKVLALALREVKKQAAQESDNARRRETHKVERLDPAFREKEVARVLVWRKKKAVTPVSENS